MVQGLLEQAADIGGLAHVGLHGNGGGTCGFDRRDHFHGAISALDVVDHDRRALLAQSLGNAAPDAP